MWVICTSWRHTCHLINLLFHSESKSELFSCFTDLQQSLSLPVYYLHVVIMTFHTIHFGIVVVIACIRKPCAISHWMAVVSATVAHHPPAWSVGTCWWCAARNSICDCGNLWLQIAFSALTWLVGRQEERLTCKKWVMGCWFGYLFGARCPVWARGNPFPLTRRDGVVVSIVHGMSEVNLCRARLVLGWVTVSERVYHHVT